MQRGPKHFYEFGPFRLDVNERQLLRDGHPVPLTPKAFETLHALVENSGHVLSKDELLKRVWPDTFVDEGTLARNVFTLRKALGEEQNGQHHIETVPKLGYRFIASVKETDGETPLDTTSQQSSAVFRTQPRLGRLQIVALISVAVLLVAAYFARERFWPPSRTAAGRSMLAVLPFENLSGDPQQEYFSDGLTEEMITQLGSLNPQRLGVIARTSAMKYRNTDKGVGQIGRELAVDYVLEGSVRREGNRVRVSAQLIQVKDQTHLWADSYERDLRDVLVLQSDVARAIAREIEIKLTPQQQARHAGTRPIDPEAYELYLQGRYFWNKRTEEGFKKAIEYFTAAIRKDANYGQAYAGLADSYALLGSIASTTLPRREAMPKARAAALKALELDDTLAEAHTSLAFVRMHYDWDWPGAEREFARAIGLNPGYATAHHWYAYDLVARGRTDEALREVRRAQEIDPLSTIISADLGEILCYARRDDEAIEQARRTLKADPNFVLAHRVLAWAYQRKHMYAESIAVLERASTLPGATSAGVLPFLGHVYAMAGQRDDARKVLGQLERKSRERCGEGFGLVAVYAGLGDKDQAFACLEKAYQEREGTLILLNVLPPLDPLRSDPRFADLLRRVGLPP
jgi:TolB-like protein/DNA-binding winged helix-turn-helix (wHTH) protein/Tfp pilus assembly protein PilF